MTLASPRASPRRWLLRLFVLAHVGCSAQRRSPLLWEKKSAAADASAKLPSAVAAPDACPPEPSSDERVSPELRQLHFVHVPKTAGASFHRAVRHAACLLNGANQSHGCCLPDAGPEADNRYCRARCARPACAALLGCDYCECGGAPQLKYVGAGGVRSFTMLRHPTSRLISGYFYARPGPARPDRREPLEPGPDDPSPTLPYTFEEYINMPENQNVMVKMFARDVFGHKKLGSPLNTGDLNKAKKVLEKFSLVGIAEMFALSVRVLVNQLDLKDAMPSRVQSELAQLALRPTASPKHKAALIAQLKQDKALSQRLKLVNKLDEQLFMYGRWLFCEKLRYHGLGRLDSAQVCHRPVALLNGLEDAACPSEPRAVIRVREPHLRWMTAHFVHIPKSGGSSFGRVIRRVMCAANAFSEALDCCIADETTWCDTGCNQPDCQAVYGCRYCDCRHTPQLIYMDRAASVTILRHPSDRAVSGYFFRGHSPNWDRFGVRKEFPRDPKAWPYSFDEYLEMPEYQNIATRMFAYDSFPYRNLTISREHLESAKERLRNFRVIGLNEAYNASVHIMQSAFDIGPVLTYAQLIGADTYADNPQTLKQSSHRNKYNKFRDELKGDPALQRRVADRNWADIELFEYGQQLFCERLPVFQKEWMAPLIGMPHVRQICARFDAAATPSELPPIRPNGYEKAHGLPQKQPPQMWKGRQGTLANGIEEKPTPFGAKPRV